MSNSSEEVVNSLPETVSKPQTEETSEENIKSFKKKDFVFTEKRRENLIKANKARKEKEDFKKQLKDKYEETTIELQRLYEAKINSFKNNAENNPDQVSMSSIKSEKTTQPIEIQQVPQMVKTTSKKNHVETSSESEISEEEVQRKRKKSKVVKKPKKVIYVSDSDESEEEVIVKKKKSKKRRKMESESESDDDSIYEARPQRRVPVPTNNNQPRKVGMHSGCIF